MVIEINDKKNGKNINGKRKEGLLAQKEALNDGVSDKLGRMVLTAISLAFLPSIVLPIFEKLNFFYPYAGIAVIIAIWFWIALFGESISGIYGIAEKEIKRLEPKEDSAEDVELKELKTADQITILWRFAVKVIFNLWITRIFIVYIAAMLVALAVYTGLEITLVALLIFISLIAYFGYSYGIKYFNEHTKEIKADPPTVGVLTFFGSPRRVLFASGLAFTRPPVIDFISIDTSQTTVDFKGKLSGFFSSDGVPVSLSSVKMVYTPDKTRIMEFISTKKHAGIADITEDLVPSKLRPLIRKEPIDNLIGKTKREEKDKSAAAVDSQNLENAVIAELTGIPEKDIDAEVKKSMSKNGISDVHRFGIKINKFSIGMIDTAEDYAEDLRKLAREEKQRKAETYEVETEIMQAKTLFEAFKDADEPLTFEECLKIVKDDKLVREGHDIIPGLRSHLSRKDGGGIDFLAGIAAILRGGRSDNPVKARNKEKGKKKKGNEESENE